MPEVTEQEYIQARNLNNFAHQLMQHPQASRLLEQAAKLVNPNIRTPRLDQDAATTAPVVALAESIEKINKRLEDEAVARANDAAVAAANKIQNDGIAALRAKGWNDAGIAEIQKVMTEKGIADPLDAAIVFEQRYPPATVAAPGSATMFNMNDAFHAQQSDDDIKLLLKSRGKADLGFDAIGDKMIASALAEVRGGQR